MAYESEIEVDDQLYFLNVSDDERPGEYPATIQLAVEVGKIVGDSHYPMDTLLIRYDTKSRKYLLLSDSASCDEAIYTVLIDRLDDDYGDL